MSDKLFIVTRSDLPPGARAAQLAHAALAFAFEHSEIAKSWHLNSNNIVLLEAKDEQALHALGARAGAAKIAWTMFREPDFDNATTAIAIAPEGWRIVSSLPLALREPKKAA